MNLSKLVVKYAIHHSTDREFAPISKNFQACPDQKLSLCGCLCFSHSRSLTPLSLCNVWVLSAPCACHPCVIMFTVFVADISVFTLVTQLLSPSSYSATCGDESIILGHLFENFRPVSVHLISFCESHYLEPEGNMRLHVQVLNIHTCTQMHAIEVDGSFCFFTVLLKHSPLYI